MTDCNVCIGTFQDYEHVEMSCIRTPKARKEHICCECRGVIKPGERYQRYSGKYDGSMFDSKTCLQCAEIIEVFSCGEGPPAIGALWEDMEEYAFPELTTASKCFQKLSPESKQFVLDRWNKWKFGRKQ